MGDEITNVTDGVSVATKSDEDKFAVRNRAYRQELEEKNLVWMSHRQATQEPAKIGEQHHQPTHGHICSTNTGIVDPTSLYLEEVLCAEAGSGSDMMGL